MRIYHEDLGLRLLDANYITHEFHRCDVKTMGILYKYYKNKICLGAVLDYLFYRSYQNRAKVKFIIGLCAEKYKKNQVFRMVLNSFNKSLSKTYILEARGDTPDNLYIHMSYEYNNRRVRRIFKNCSAHVVDSLTSVSNIFFDSGKR
jgi:hypothetical protein